MTGMAIAAALMLILAASPGLGLAAIPLMFCAGVATGTTGPSRDVLIRRAARGIGMGSVFGFVYSGFDLGSSTAPLLFGALMDHHSPHAVFLGVASPWRWRCRPCSKSSTASAPASPGRRRLQNEHRP